MKTEMSDNACWVWRLALFAVTIIGCAFACAKCTADCEVARMKYRTPHPESP